MSLRVNLLHSNSLNIYRVYIGVNWEDCKVGKKEGRGVGLVGGGWGRGRIRKKVKHSVLSNLERAADVSQELLLHIPEGTARRRLYTCLATNTFYTGMPRRVS